MPSCVKRRKRVGRPKKTARPLCKKSSRKSSSKRKSSKKRKGSKKRTSTGKRKSRSSASKWKEIEKRAEKARSRKKYVKGVKGSPDLETLEDCTKKFHISHVRMLAKGMGVRSGTKLQMCAGILEKMKTKKGEEKVMKVAEEIPPPPPEEEYEEPLTGGRRLGAEWEGKRVVY